MDKDIVLQLYETYSKEIWLYLFSLSHSKQIAEDLMQETFLKAILALSEHHGNMRAWLYKVARNLYINYHKKSQAEELLNYLDETGNSFHENNVLDGILQDERKRILYQALEKIDERKREVLILYYYSGLNQKQIAATMQISPENVRILAHRAKKDVKKILEVNGYDIS